MKNNEKKVYGLSPEKISLLESLRTQLGTFTKTILKGIGVTTKEAKEAGFKVFSPRYVKGDLFYKNLPYKRIKGKWQIKR